MITVIVLQAEKGLKAQLAALTAQLAQTQATLKQEEASVQKLREDLKSSQASLRQEVQGAESRLAELKEQHTRQREQEARMKEQLAAVSKALEAERSHKAELQRSHESVKESLTQLQSDCYGKESELLALQQDLKVGARGGGHSSPGSVLGRKTVVQQHIHGPVQEAALLDCCRPLRTRWLWPRRTCCPVGIS